VFDVLQIAGAAYLVLLGLKMIVMPSRVESSLDDSTTRRLDSSFVQGLRPSSRIRRRSCSSPRCCRSSSTRRSR
jgi:hypothetical protein